MSFTWIFEKGIGWLLVWVGLWGFVVGGGEVNAQVVGGVAPLEGREIGEAGWGIDVLWQRGQRRQQEDDWAGAREDYQAVLRFAPSHVGARLGLAEEALVRKDTAAALLQLHLAERVQLNNAQLHWLRGRILEVQGNLLEAADSYREALHHDAGFLEAQKGLAGLLRLLRGKRSVVQKAAERFELTPTLANLTLFGQLIVRHSTPQQTLLEFEQLRNRHPELAETELWVARAFHGLGQTKMAVDAYRRYLQIRPRAHRVHLLLLKYLQQSGQQHEAWSESQRLAQLMANPVQGEFAADAGLVQQVGLLQAGLAIELGYFDKVGTLLLKVDADSKEASLPVETEVAALFGRVLALQPEAGNVHISYGEWLRRHGLWSEAIAVLTQAGLSKAKLRRQVLAELEQLPREQLGPQQQGSRLLGLARLELASRHYELAVKNLQRIPSSWAAQDEVLLLRAEILQASGDQQAAQQAYTAYVQLFDGPEKALALAETFWLRGQHEHALKLWQPHLKALPTIRLQELGNWLQQQQRTTEEIAYRRELAERHPQKIPNLQRLAELLTAKQDPQALTYWEKSLTAQPHSYHLLLQTAHAHAQWGEPKREITLLQRADNLQPLPLHLAIKLARGHLKQKALPQALQQYWKIYQRKPNSSEAQKQLIELTLRTPTHTEIRLAAASLAQKSQLLPQAAELMRLALENHPELLTQRIQLARLYLRLQQPLNAESSLIQQPPPLPKNSNRKQQNQIQKLQRQQLQLLLQIQRNLHRQQPRLQTLQQLLALTPNSPSLNKETGLLLLELNHPRQAHPYLLQALQYTPKDAQLLQTLLALETSLQLPKLAAKRMETLLKIFPERHHLRFQLVDLLASQKRWRTANKQLESLIQLRPLDPQLRQRSVVFYLKRFQHTKAKKHYLVLKKISPPHARSLARHFE